MASIAVSQSLLGFVGELSHERGVNAALIGRHGANFWTRPRYASRFQVLIRGSVRPVSAGLESAGFETLRESPPGSAEPDFVRMHRAATRDLVELFAARSDFQDAVVTRAVRGAPDELPVATAEDLIVLALIGRRRDDELDILDLIEAQPEIDWAYIEQWAHVWEVDEALAMLRQELATRRPGLP